jgi:hypothetical protein
MLVPNISSEAETKSLSLEQFLEAVKVSPTARAVIDPKRMSTPAPREAEYTRSLGERLAHLVQLQRRSGRGRGRFRGFATGARLSSPSGL